MSIEAMTLVWKYSKQRGSLLLLELALADYANDKLVAWPSISTLARKIRMSRRYALDLLIKLEATKEIKVVAHGDKNHSNHYLITIKPIKEPDELQGMVVNSASLGNPASLGREAHLPRVGRRGAKGREAGLPLTTNNHHITVNEPAAAAAAGEWDLEAIWATSGLKGNPEGDAHKFIGLYLYAMTQSKLHSPARYAASRMKDGKVQRPFKDLAELKPCEVAAVLDYLSGRDDLFASLNGAQPAALALREMVPQKDKANRLERAFVDLGLSHCPEEVREYPAREERGPATPGELWGQAVASARTMLGAFVLERLGTCRRVEMRDGKLIIFLANNHIQFFKGQGKSQLEILRRFANFELELEAEHGK